ncbi:MAG: nucleotidyltransferase family protein [Candidatus Azobacteroides sp.]|nr:nucleotidyltransferase family protein [Candidatus Azobacteroides sp.]
MNVKPKDALLLHLFFSDTLTQENVDTLLSGYEMDNARLEFSLLVALLRKKHPEVQFPQSIIPRLDGIVRFFHVKNAALLEGFNEIGKALSERGIPILLTKGVVMKYFRPDEPRFMSDVDFIVPEDFYEEAVQIAKDLGFSGVQEHHSTDLTKGGAFIDIHRLFLHGGEKEGAIILKNMFANAKKTSAFGVDVLIPSKEDFMLLMISNSYHNIAVQPSIHIGSYYYFFDCARLIEDNKNLDWDAIFETASKSGNLYQIWVYLELMNQLIPAFLPEGLLAKIPIKSEDPMIEQLKNDTLFRINDELLQQQKESKLSNCKNIPDVIFSLGVRMKRALLAVVRKIQVMRFLFLSIFFRLYKN